MKLTTLLLIIVLVQVSASEFGQKINLNEKNTPIKEVIQTIEKQSGYTFFYDTKDLPEARVTVRLRDASIDEALKEIFKDVPLTTYKIVKNNVVLSIKEPNVKPEANNLIEVPPPINITGTVKDAKSGESIVGVTVRIEGTSNGVITDVNGKFMLKIPKPDVVIVFSCVGYDVQRVVLKGQFVLGIRLMPSLSKLDEVVVVAFGKQKKVSVTGAVASISQKELVKSSSHSLANALAGQLPGLTSIQSGGGQPGKDDATMYLRGAATTNGRAPLVLIDGVPRDNIRTIDPNEVESVSILKDASATAVFGVRGANGVILITTKRGVEGKPELTINAVQSYTSFTREPMRLHSQDYMNLRNEASANDNISPLPYSQAVMDKYANPLKGLDSKDPNYAQEAIVRNYMYPDHDWYREYVSKYVPESRINMNLIGGTDKVSYFINASALYQGGQFKQEPESVLGYDPSVWMKRYSFRANLDYKISKTLKAFLNIGSYIEQANMPSSAIWGNADSDMIRGGIFCRIQSILPITPGPTTIAGFGVAPGQIVHPGYMDTAFETMNRIGFRNETTSNLNSSFGLDWDLSNITKGLSVKGMTSCDFNGSTAMQGSKSERLYLPIVDYVNDVLSYAARRSDESLLSISRYATTRYNINLQGSINYNRTFGEKHTVTGMILGQRDNWETNGGDIPYNVVGLSGRITYGFDNRYLAEVNMGYNGSEQFAPGNRYGFFPAMSAGWVVSNEDFLKANPFITNLKLRVSYGKVGNDQMGGARFLYQDNISMGGGYLGSLGLGQGINQGLLGNPNLSWEIAGKQNYGVDMQLFKDLNASFDYFVEHRSNILISRGTVPAFQGVALGNIPKVNMGLVDNHGYEIELTYNKSIAKDLSLRISSNFGYNHNIVKFYDEPIRDSTYAYRYRTTGYSMNQNWGYKIDYSNGNGYFNAKEELDTYLAKTKYAFGTPSLGDFKYLDINGDGIINDKDQAPIGLTTIPGVTYGLTLNLTYKSFDFTAFIQGVGQYSGAYGGWSVYENQAAGTYFDFHRTAWTAERYARGEKITYPALSTQTSTNQVNNDFFIMNRSFTRLRNIELGYTLSKGTLKRFGVQNLRIYVSAQNLFTWDHLRAGHLDPENDDTIGYPITKMENFGINITF